MPQVIQTASNFNAGAIDPLLAARVDIEQYYSAVAQATNCVSPPQGGLQRRPGLVYEDTLAGDGRLFGFSFNTEQNYILVFTDLQIEVFKDGVSQTTIVTPYAEADLFELDMTQSADTAIIVHPDYEPRTLTRTSDTSWTLSTITFIDVPQYDYNDASSPTPTSEIQDIVFTSFGVNRIYRLELDGLLTEELDYNNQETGVNENLIKRALESLPTIPAGDVTVAFQSGTTYRVTFSGGAADAWGLMTGRVVLGSGSISVTRVQTGVPRKENVWSAGRGWPRTATFHESRLWFGGTKGRPQTVFGSASGDFFNFYTGDGNDADAIVVTLDTDQVNAIQAVHSARHFQVFTTGGEFYVPSPEGQPITPSNILFRRVTQHGSKKIRPVIMDGVTLFVERRGKIIREFIYEFAEEGYTAPSASLLSSHLIDDPVDMAALRGTSSDQANYVYFINGDGTVAVFNILRAQAVNTWTNWSTDGNFKSVAVIDDETYFLVERTLNASTVYLLEKLDSTAYTDSSVQYSGAATSTITGLGHLNGEECRVRADGTVQPNATPSSGSITLERTATAAEVGLDFNPTIVTLPPASNFAEGNTYNRRKRIVRAACNVHETLGLRINGELQPERTFGPDVLDDAPTPFTGQFEVFVLGWEDFPTLTITQEDPLPMYIRQLVQEVHVS